MNHLTGLHHVTAFAKSPDDNVRFYTQVLRLRLIKRTVNFDDPSTYHLYYGDHSGAPGTLLTHFPHPLAARAKHGGEEITDAILAVPAGSLAAWRHRLTSAGVTARDIEIFGEPVIAFEDHDGMGLAMLERSGSSGAAPETRSGTSAPAVEAIGAVAGVTLRVPDADETATFLCSTLGGTLLGTEGERRRIGIGPHGSFIDLLHDPVTRQVPMGAGTIHHVAWRVPDDATQHAVSELLSRGGIAVTPVRDRQYFRSIYFRIPGNVLFEVATDGPGFTIDEPLEHLGEALRIPPQYERARSTIEQSLPPLAVDAGS